jgi:hypothetical protein
MNLELITWEDAGGEQDGGWQDPDDVDTANSVIQSVGWVIKETEKNITLAMDLSDDGQTHTRSRIPKGMIVSRQVLCIN